METAKKQVVAIVEVGENYTDRLRTMEVEKSSIAQAQQAAREKGYHVIDDLCTIVHTIDEIHIIVAVEPEGATV